MSVSVEWSRRRAVRHDFTDDCRKSHCQSRWTRIAGYGRANCKERWFGQCERRSVLVFPSDRTGREWPSAIGSSGDQWCTEFVGDALDSCSLSKMECRYPRSMHWRIGQSDDEYSQSRWSPRFNFSCFAKYQQWTVSETFSRIDGGIDFFFSAGFPKQTAAQTILAALSKFFRQTTTASLKQVFFVLYDPESVNVYTTELQRMVEWTLDRGQHSSDFFFVFCTKWWSMNIRWCEFFSSLYQWFRPVSLVLLLATKQFILLFLWSFIRSILLSRHSFHDWRTDVVDRSWRCVLPSSSSVEILSFEIISVHRLDSKDSSASDRCRKFQRPRPWEYSSRWSVRMFIHESETKSQSMPSDFLHLHI